MFKSKVLTFGAAATVIAAVAAGAATNAAAQDKAQDQGRDRMQQSDQDRMFGSQLMTQQERMEYASRMRGLKTDQERLAFRLEHHKKMQERARERGVTLPDEPPQMPGRAMGGAGMGGARGGMGPGGAGMGPGGGAGGAGPAR